jgi:hypothetical protein
MKKQSKLAWVGTTNLELAIENFDFKKVHTIMSIMGWCWNEEENAPSIRNMKELVKELYESLGENNWPWASRGGFRVEENSDGIVTIMFVLEESDSTW